MYMLAESELKDFHGLKTQKIPFEWHLLHVQRLEGKPSQHQARIFSL